jgi:hypothetical protein
LDKDKLTRLFVKYLKIKKTEYNSMKFKITQKDQYGIEDVYTDTSTNILTELIAIDILISPLRYKVNNLIVSDLSSNQYRFFKEKEALLDSVYFNTIFSRFNANSFFSSPKLIINPIIRIVDYLDPIVESKTIQMEQIIFGVQVYDVLTKKELFYFYLPIQQIKSISMIVSSVEENIEDEINFHVLEILENNLDYFVSKIQKIIGTKELMAQKEKAIEQVSDNNKVSKDFVIGDILISRNAPELNQESFIRLNNNHIMLDSDQIPQFIKILNISDENNFIEYLELKNNSSAYTFNQTVDKSKKPLKSIFNDYRKINGYELDMYTNKMFKLSFLGNPL